MNYSKGSHPLEKRLTQRAIAQANLFAAKGGAQYRLKTNGLVSGGDQ